jgi:hypothetical protein
MRSKQEKQNREGETEVSDRHGFRGGAGGLSRQWSQPARGTPTRKAPRPLTDRGGANGDGALFAATSSGVDIPLARKAPRPRGRACSPRGSTASRCGKANRPADSLESQGLLRVDAADASLGGPGRLPEDVARGCRAALVRPFFLPRHGASHLDGPACRALDSRARRGLRESTTVGSTDGESAAC